MSPYELGEVLDVLNGLGRDVTSDLIDVYMSQQEGKSREFFDIASHRSTGKLMPEIQDAFAAKMAATPLEMDPVEVLLRIADRNGWNPQDIDCLSSLTADEILAMLKNVRGDDLRAIIDALLGFGRMAGTENSYKLIYQRTVEAMRLIAKESELNAMRLKPYLPVEE